MGGGEGGGDGGEPRGFIYRTATEGQNGEDKENGGRGGRNELFSLRLVGVVACAAEPCEEGGDAGSLVVGLG